MSGFKKAQDVPSQVSAFRFLHIKFGAEIAPLMTDYNMQARRRLRIANKRKTSLACFETV